MPKRKPRNQLEKEIEYDYAQRSMKLLRSIEEKYQKKIDKEYERRNKSLMKEKERKLHNKKIDY